MVCVFEVPCDAIVPPVAKMVTFGSEALMAVWTSCRTKILWTSDLERSIGEAKANDVSERRCAMVFIL